MVGFLKSFQQLLNFSLFLSLSDHSSQLTVISQMLCTASGINICEENYTQNRRHFSKRRQWSIGCILLYAIQPTTLCLVHHCVALLDYQFKTGILTDIWEGLCDRVILNLYSFPLHTKYTKHNHAHKTLTVSFPPLIFVRSVRQYRIH